VQTPVGARCRDCARSDKLPTFAVQPVHYVKAIGAMLGTASVCGVIWAVIAATIPFFSFNFILAAGTGYAIAELVSRSVNRKRGPILAVIAACGVIIAYVTTLILPFGNFFPGFGHGFLFDFLAIIVGIIVAAGRLR
jgi:hypothetical protein